MKSPRVKLDAEDLGVDAEVGNLLVEVKIGVSATRSIRVGLMQLAHALAERPRSRGVLVLPDVGVTPARLRQEWQRAASVLRPELLRRLSLCAGDGAGFIGIPHDPDARTRRILSDIVAKERPRVGSPIARSDASFVVTKVLLHHWLTNGGPVTADWLANTSGYSYPTVASVLQRLGSLIERASDRRIRFRSFPREEFSRLLAISSRARSTVRFADRSGKARSPEQHVRRLQTLKVRGLAIGGVLGARHYFPDLDLVGVPRLDLSQHTPKRHLDLAFVERLDPALRRIEDPQEPANLVVHAVRHAEPLFARREGGLHWADPVDCLLDLYEARLDAQASQFLKALEKSRNAAGS